MLALCSRDCGASRRFQDELNFGDVCAPAAKDSCVNPDFFEQSDFFGGLFKPDSEVNLGNILLDHSPYVQSFEGNIPEALPAHGPRSEGELMARAIPPIEVTLKVPLEWTPGSLVRISGAEGTFSARLQGNPQPGDQSIIRLRPKPEFKIQVPPGSLPGSDIKFRRLDGSEVVATVPEGLYPGDVFDVLPPSLMVQVPDGAVAGSMLRFRLCDNDVKLPCELKAKEKSNEARLTPYCLATVPEGVECGDYFAVRIPE